jgi:hypothetical protein
MRTSLGLSAGKHRGAGGSRAPRGFLVCLENQAKITRTITSHNLPTNCGEKALFSRLHCCVSLQSSRSFFVSLGFEEGGLGTLKQLQTFDLRDTNATDAGLKELAGLKLLQTLCIKLWDMPE